MNRRIDLLILKDLDWLRAERQTKTCQEIADQLNCFRTSVDFACRVFSPEEKATFKYDRKHKKIQ